MTEATGRLWLIIPLLVACALTAYGVRAAEHSAPGASSCSGCHGPAGSSEIPSLDRLSAAEIEAALGDYRSGARAGTIMPRIAKGFSATEARAIAASLGRSRAATP